MGKRKIRVGDVIQIALPNGLFAYGRILNDAAIGIYQEITSEPNHPPLGSRDFQFIVGIYDDAVRSSEFPVVGFDPNTNPDDDWPPPRFIKDPIAGKYKIYHLGVISKPIYDDLTDLEEAAIWDMPDIISRIMKR